MIVFEKALCPTTGCEYWRRDELEDSNADGCNSKLCPKCGATLEFQWTPVTKKKRPRTLSGVNKDAAEGLLGSKPTQLKLNKYIPLKLTGNIRFDDLADDYLKYEMKMLKDPKRAESCARELKAYFGGALLSDMNYANIMAYSIYRQAQTKKVRRKEWTPRVWKRNFKVPRQQPQPKPLLPPKKICPATVGRELSVLYSILRVGIKMRLVVAIDDHPLWW